MTKTDKGNDLKKQIYGKLWMKRGMHVKTWSVAWMGVSEGSAWKRGQGLIRSWVDGGVPLTVEEGGTGIVLVPANSDLCRQGITFPF